MTRNPISPSSPPSRPRRHPWSEGVFVLGPLAVAALVTALGVGADVVAPLWLAALAWAALASLAGALRRGFRRGNGSAFGGHALRKDDGGDLDEWASRTGCYAWLGDLEDRLRDDDRLR